MDDDDTSRCDQRRRRPRSCADRLVATGRSAHDRLVRAYCGRSLLVTTAGTPPVACTGRLATSGRRDSATGADGLSSCAATRAASAEADAAPAGIADPVGYRTPFR